MRSCWAFIALWAENFSELIKGVAIKEEKKRKMKKRKSRVVDKVVAFCFNIRIYLYDEWQKKRFFIVFTSLFTTKIHKTLQQF